MLCINWIYSRCSESFAVWITVTKAAVRNLRLPQWLWNTQGLPSSTQLSQPLHDGEFWNDCWGDNHSVHYCSERHSKWFEICGKRHDFMVSTSEVMKDIKSSEIEIVSSTNEVAKHLIIIAFRIFLFSMIEITDTLICEQRFQISLYLQHKLWNYQRLSPNFVHLGKHRFKCPLLSVDTMAFKATEKKPKPINMFFWPRVIFG